MSGSQLHIGSYETHDFPDNFPDLFSGEDKPFMPINSAIISSCEQYRYFLSRQLKLTGGSVLFIGLNPSTADHREDDPTIRKLKEFTLLWGYGSFGIVNLFGFRSAKPAEMKKAPDPVGEGNDAEIRKAIKLADLIVPMWGNEGRFKDRGITVKHMIKEAIYKPNMKCFGRNKNGSPKHPLYLPYSTELTDYS